MGCFIVVVDVVGVVVV